MERFPRHPKMDLGDTQNDRREVGGSKLGQLIYMLSDEELENVYTVFFSISAGPDQQHFGNSVRTYPATSATGVSPRYRACNWTNSTVAAKCFRGQLWLC